jgi:hypothetical protein
MDSTNNDPFVSICFGATEKFSSNADDSALSAHFNIHVLKTGCRGGHHGPLTVLAMCRWAR